MPFLRLFRFFFYTFLLFAAVVPARAELNAQEQQIANYMANSSGQNRAFVTVDPILSKVARARAMDLAKRHYFAHVNPDGKGPNYLVRQAGYPLPESYNQAANANNIESIAAGDPTASGTWSLWMGSAPHKKHLLAQESFYTEQTSIGVGYYHDSNSDYFDYWVVITAPPAGPTLTVTSPAANAGLTTNQVTVTGTAAGAPAAAQVVVRVENASGTGAFINASGTKSWSATLGLVAGSNTLRTRSLDAGGTTIKEVTRVVRYVVLKPLIVSVEGSGTVTKGFAGTTQREIGATYKVTATAATGWIFDRWSGSSESTAATISFVMAEGFQLMANFRENPFYALKNSYTGLVEAEAAAHESSGILKVSTTATGGFSGKITLAGKTFSVRGNFDADGNALVTIPRKTLTPLTVSLHLDLTGGTGLLTGSVTDETFTAELSADPATAPKEIHRAAGRYTVALQPNPDDSGAQYPQGTGCAVLVVSKAGIASLSGTLANGAAFASRINVAADGVLPLYVPMLSGTGSLIGELMIDSETGSITGSTRWTKPATPKAAVFRDAFATTLSDVGSRYIAPLAGNTSLHVVAPVNNSSLQLSGGDLASGVQQTATILPTNRVAISDPVLAKLSIKITASNGWLSGSFTHPVTGAASKIRGVILQDRNVATGYFLGSSQSGHASLAPTTN